MPATRRARAAAAGILVALLVTAASADYVVQKGDTLADIAAAHGTTASEIAAANGLANPNLIRIGQVLVIPAPQGSPVRYHLVVPGDNLAAIAATYGSSVSAIAAANGIANPDLIMVGLELVIPNESSGTSAPPPAVHVVAAGETLGTIAARYGTTSAVLAAANGITDPNLIFVGTRLQLTGETFVAPPAPVTSTHVVAPGETLSMIAAQNGTDPASLAAVNALSDPNLIMAGQVLSVPAAGWVCPVPGATYFNDWGFPRPGGRFHTGNDLFAPIGTPVLAPVSGTVRQIDGIVGGLQFKLFGDDGNVYLGSHLSGFGQGGYVAAGTVIGYIGDSGNASGSRPHLHFEIHAGGAEEVNPFPTLQGYGC